MILFSSKKLEKALANNRITNWQKAKYIIIPAVLLAPFSATAVFVSPRFGERPPGTHTLIQLVFMIGSMLITFFGIKRCFKVNESIDRSKFLERYCILILPVTLKLFVIFFPLTIILTVIIYGIAKYCSISLPQISLIFPPLGTIFTLIYYSLLVNSFRRLGRLFGRVNF